MTDEATTENKKDEMLEKLERILETTPENSKQPIRNLINKRKVELGLMKSELLVAGYKLKKSARKAVPRKPSKATMKSLTQIAKGVGRVSEKKDEVSVDIDVKDEPLKKERKITEENDSYKY
ncbi:Uncharacterised protein [uncultured archaeon]|nr:Uncharacterised protein [uncultured archaeon]